jgi:ribosomal protein L11 methyltransferase
MDYIQLDFLIIGTERETLMARLSDVGYEAFEETEHDLRAFIPAANYDAAIVERLAGDYDIDFAVTHIAPQNWNATWEASFEPVVVPGFCTVRAAFHPKSTDTPYDIVITPKMSFGTGHHATTRKMMEAMSTIDFIGKTVLDFGTGTGILAILASMLGAREVTAIDNDEWSVENAAENVAGNKAEGIRVGLGSLEMVEGKYFDIILANINRHILLEYMDAMRGLLSKGGVLLLSGILTADNGVITASAERAGFKKSNVYAEGDWLAMKFDI